MGKATKREAATLGGKDSAWSCSHRNWAVKPNSIFDDKFCDRLLCSDCAIDFDPSSGGLGAGRRLSKDVWLGPGFRSSQKASPSKSTPTKSKGSSKASDTAMPPPLDGRRPKSPYQPRKGFSPVSITSFLKSYSGYCEGNTKKSDSAEGRELDPIDPNLRVVSQVWRLSAPNMT